MSANQTPGPPQKTSLNDTMRTVARYSNLGMALAVSVVVGVLGGQWLDARWDTAPWFLLFGAFFGVGTGLYHFIKTVLSMPSSRSQRAEDNPSRGAEKPLRGANKKKAE